MKLLLKQWFCSSGYIPFHLQHIHTIHNAITCFMHTWNSLWPTWRIWTGNLQTYTSVLFVSELRAMQLKVSTVHMLCWFTKDRLNIHSLGSHKNCFLLPKKKKSVYFIQSLGFVPQHKLKHRCEKFIGLWSVAPGQVQSPKNKSTITWSFQIALIF